MLHLDMLSIELGVTRASEHMVLLEDLRNESLVDTDPMDYGSLNLGHGR